MLTLMMIVMVLQLLIKKYLDDLQLNFKLTTRAVIVDGHLGSLAEWLLNIYLSFRFHIQLITCRMCQETE